MTTPEQLQEITRRDMIASNSDRFNYPDFAGGPRTFTVRTMKVVDGEKRKKLHIYMEGETKYYEPCLGMLRVLNAVWPDAGKQWIGRQITLYGEPSVLWAGKPIGGIQISHVSGIDKPCDTFLQVSQQKRVPYTVQPIADGGAE